MEYFNGLHLNMGNISRLSKAKTRSISAENFHGEKGAGGMATDGFSLSAAQDLGQGLESVALHPAGSQQRHHPGRD